MLVGLRLVGAHVRARARAHTHPSPNHKRPRRRSAGGGLPLIVAESPTGLERTLMPLLMRERLIDAERNTLVYQVADAGWLLQDVVPGSHQGCLTFAPAETDPTNGDAPSSTTNLTWKVSFDTYARCQLWTSVTELTVGESIRNLDAATRPDLCYIIDAKLEASPADALEEWFCCFRDGDLGAVPIPPPIVLDQGDPETGEGFERLLIPIGLRERCLTKLLTDDGRNGEVTYQVVNPSWITCFPAHSHMGSVRFTATDEGGLPMCRMRWTVSVKPRRLGGALAVRGLISAVVPMFTRRLVSRLSQTLDPEIQASWREARSSNRSQSESRDPSRSGDADGSNGLEPSL